jgi:hypothetical protein
MRHVAGLVLCAGVAVGCGGGDGRLPVFPVSGRVVDAQGRPAEKAVVTFHRAGARAGDPRPSGRVAADGTFRLSTFAENDGAPAGEYAVTVVWPGPPPKELRSDPGEEGPDRLSGRYRDPEKPAWKVTVREGPNDLDPFRLK